MSPPPDRLRADPRIVRLAQALSEFRATEVEDPAARPAAVAILLRLGPQGEPELFFIQRAIYDSDPWSGQIAFPGGRSESQDRSLLETAIRETLEETQIHLGRSAELLGALDDLRPITVALPPVVVRPFVFLMRDEPEILLSDEVAQSFWVPLSVLLDRSVWRDTTVRAGGMEMSRFAFHHEGIIVWGMTERILSALLRFLE